MKYFLTITISFFWISNCLFSKDSLQYDYIRDANSSIAKELLLDKPINYSISNCKSFGFDSATHWVRHYLKAEQTETLFLINHLAYYNQITYHLYDLTQKKWMKTAYAGTYASDKGIEWYYSGSVFSFDIVKGHQYIILAGYKVALGSIVINFELLNAQQYKKYHFRSHLISILLLAIAVAICVSALIFYFIKKLRIYLFYSVYVLGVAFLQLVNQGYLFYLIESDTETYMLIYALGSAIFVSSFIHFFVELLKTPLHPLKAEKRMALTLSMLVMGTYIMGAFITNAPQSRQILLQIQHVWFLGIIVLTIYLLIKGFRKKLPMTFYALFAQMPALFAGAIILLISSGWLDLWGYFKYNFNICILIEAVILGFALIEFERRQITYTQLMKQRITNLTGILRHNKADVEVMEDKKAYSESAYGEQDIQKYFEQIERFMTETKPFLEPDLDLSVMAEQIGTKPHVISEVINRACGINFSEYINRYRVEASKQMLRSPEYSSITIEGIGSRCGYSSKSTFYTAFKRLEGCTPAQYQKSKG